MVCGFGRKKEALLNDKIVFSIGDGRKVSFWKEDQ